MGLQNGLVAVFWGSQKAKEKHCFCQRLPGGSLGRIFKRFGVDLGDILCLFLDMFSVVFLLCSSSFSGFLIWEMYETYTN